MTITTTRLRLSAVALSALISLVGCVAGSPSGTPSAEPSAAPTTPTATSTTSAPAYGNPTDPRPAVDSAAAWPQSVCAKLDPKSVTAVFGGTPRTDRRWVSTWVDDPMYDVCSIGMDLNGRPGSVSLGISILPQTPAGWAAAVAKTRKVFPMATALPGSTPGYLLAGSAATLVGDRAVLARKSLGMTADQATKLIALVRPLLASQPLAPLIQADPQCDQMSQAAAVVLGETVVMRRDRHDAPGELTCVWAGEHRGVWMQTTPQADAVADVKDSQLYTNAQVVSNLGAYATWVGNNLDGYVLTVASPKKAVLRFETGFGQEADRIVMVDLAKAALAAGF